MGQGHPAVYHRPDDHGRRDRPGSGGDCRRSKKIAPLAIKALEVQHYLAPDGLALLIRRMEALEAAGVLNGIVFADFYLLFALSDAAPDLAARIEAMPSINFMLDSAPKVFSVLEMIQRTRFQLPRKITLDRDLNRRPSDLQALGAICRQRYPEMEIELLANEGCLFQCPFRATHEALIAAANTGMLLDTFRLNRDLACFRQFSQSPHRLLTSPFIRPEDIPRYEKSADILKICGRTLGSRFLMRTIIAYAAGRYHGNLPDLLDATNWMAEKWMIPNQDLPSNFLDLVTTC